jgi:NADPH:quinone reductase-like Zn-dependent oxidoreductase
MSKAVQFDQFGDIDVLDVRDVERPQPRAGEVLVEVKAAGINPGEASIRKGGHEGHIPYDVPVRTGQ